MAQRSFWGRYDVRAVVSDDFGPAQYRLLGQTYAQYLDRTLGQPETPFWVSVGHDARLHSPELVAALIDGLTGCGINVMALGLSTSPIVYFSEHAHELTANFPSVAGSLMVTASHNPCEYNGLKLTYQKRALEAEEFLALQTLYRELEAVGGAPKAAQPGIVKPYDILPDYRQWFEGHFGKIGEGIKIVADSGNATAGIVAPDVLRALGCEVIELFSEPDGTFPNHHPDPCVHKNLEILIDTVRQHGADLGVAFDGDSDRLGLVDNQGRIMPGDQIVMFLTADVLAKHPGALIAFDIKSTQTLFDYVRGLKGDPILAQSGHALMKRLMRERDIPLGGELSGHLFFRDRHWGFDDALYGACRVIESLTNRRKAKPGYALNEFGDALPQTMISEEIRLHCTHEEGQRVISDLTGALKQDPAHFGPTMTRMETMDGLRVNFEDGFFLVRASGTEPCITLRFEAPDETSYRAIERRIDALSEELGAVSGSH